MSEVVANLHYTQDHEWIRDEGDGVVSVGITDHAQEALGDLVFVELPEVGTHFDQGDECAVVESVKAASDVYAPVSGEVVEVNEALADAPETINDSAYEEGWIMKIKLSDAAELEGTMDADAYTEHLANED